MLGRDFNSRGMETCRGSIPPLRRILVSMQAAAARARFKVFFRSLRRRLVTSAPQAAHELVDTGSLQTVVHAVVSLPEWLRGWT